MAVAVQGTGEREFLEDPGVWLVPSARWLAPLLLAVTTLVALIMLATAMWPWVRPVQLRSERLSDLYRPSLELAGESWRSPGTLNPDLSQVRFCRNLLSSALAGHTGAVAPRTPTPGAQAYTATFTDRQLARTAVDRLDLGIRDCPTRPPGSWAPLGAAEVGATRVARFALQNSSYQPMYASTVLYANTVTLVVTRTDTDAAELARAYQKRVASISRLD